MNRKELSDALMSFDDEVCNLLEQARWENIDGNKKLTLSTDETLELILNKLRSSKVYLDLLPDYAEIKNSPKN
jgi:hypothetical protein